MNAPLSALLAIAALLTVLGVILIIVKAVNSWRRRFDAVSRASYVAVFGELTSRGSYPQEVLAAWTDDPVFRQALVDFIRLLDGIERDRLLRVARDLGIVDEAARTLETSRRTKRRVVAAAMLAELADPHTSDVLMAALGDPVSAVRINASAGLAKIGQPDLVGPILETVDQETEWDAARTMDQLTSLGSGSVDGLIAYLGDLNERMPTYARLAVQTLGVIGDLRAEPIVLHALANPDTELRIVAAGALQTCGTVRCVGPLVKALDDPDGRVRARAAKSVGAHFDERAVEPLSERLRDREWWVRKNAAASLVHLPGGIAALQRALRDDDLFARDAAREQLMLMGIPAGSDGDDTDAESDWINEQLRTLETTAGPLEPAGESPIVEGAEPPEWLREQLGQLERISRGVAHRPAEATIDVRPRTPETAPRSNRALGIRPQPATRMSQRDGPLPAVAVAAGGADGDLEAGTPTTAGAEATDRSDGTLPADTDPRPARSDDALDAALAAHGLADTGRDGGLQSTSGAQKVAAPEIRRVG